MIAAPHARTCAHRPRRRMISTDTARVIECRMLSEDAIDRAQDSCALEGLFEESGHGRPAARERPRKARWSKSGGTADEERPSSFGHARRSALVTLLAAKGPCEPTRGGARARSGKNRTSRGDDGAARVAAAAEQGACGGRTAVAYESGDLPTRPTQRSRSAEHCTNAGDCP